MADPEGKQLVSLALLDETGQHRFYSEVDPLPEQPTNWVRSVKSIFRDHPEQALRRHHAGVDAEALCWAFAKVARGSMREG